MEKMKLTQKDLDQALLDKINKLDPIIEKFTEDDLNGYITYNGQEFLIKKINDINLRKITSTSEMNKFKDYFFKESETIKNSFETNFNMGNRPNRHLRSQILELQGNNLFTPENNIRATKKEKDYILILDTKGIFYKYNLIDKKLDFSLNIVTKVKTLFAVGNFNCYDILDFEIFKGGFLFSTIRNGIFFADIVNNSLEVLYSEENIRVIKNLCNEKIMLISDEGTISVCDSNTCMRTDKFNFMKKLNQAPKKVIHDENTIIILGKSKFNNSTENLLHIMKKDLGCLAFENVSGSIFPGIDNNLYNPTFLSKDDNYIYVSGMKNGKNLFIWKYNQNKLEEKFEEILIKDLEFSNLDFMRIYDDEIIVSYNGRIISLNKDGKILRNLDLKDIGAIQDIYTEKEERKFVIVTEKGLFSFRFPEYSYEPLFVAKVYEGEPINNIEIFMTSNTGRENVVLIDGETSTEIIPTYYIVNNQNTFIRLLGTTTNLIMKINVPEDTEIDRIVVNAEKIFLK
jgi:hypothetical protein